MPVPLSHQAKSLKKQIEQQLPKKVEVCGILFDVELKELEDAMGECHILTKTIYVDPARALSMEEAESTLFHEILHAILATSGLTALMDEKSEEAVVLCFENYLAPLINVSSFKVDL